MKNPLNKRFPRELKSEIGKYLAIFLLMVSTIGFVSGFLVADYSMMVAYDESFEKYNIEDGYFDSSTKVNKGTILRIEETGNQIFENFYVEKELNNGSTLRLFKNREEVDLVCLMQGEFPREMDEVAIDRMYADNNGISIGDTLTSGQNSWKVVGLVALSDYSSLFSSNNDSMFDSIKFGVGIISTSQFESYKSDELIYHYSWIYGEKPETEIEKKEMAEDFMKVLNEEVSLETYVPEYLNQAIHFTGDDMGSDKAMMTVLLYIVIVIMAFVFALTASQTISKEATVIGTLRASGYTKKELLLHYITMPIIVTLLGALVGNVLGYTLLEKFCADLYYGSYSLPTYQTIFSAEAFVMTTVIPIFMMFVINYGVLKHSLSLTPLQFLRRDLTHKKQVKAIRLKKKWNFFRRFRIRVLIQNKANYLVLFIGILFANLLLMFGMLLPSLLENYQKEMENNLLANYQTILQVPLSTMSENHKLESMMNLMLFQKAVETEDSEAERFSAYSLKTLEGKIKSEEVMLYGIQEESQYVPLSFVGDEVIISSAYAEKYKIKVGDTITLKESYEDTEYSFLVGGVYNYNGVIAVFMNRNQLNKTFDLGNDYFSGYFSNQPLGDVDEKYIASVIDVEDLTKISRQLNVSMGSMMGLVDGFAIGIFMILIYLLSKVIIDKNAQSISMVKILGYTEGEIAGLYIMSTSMMVLLFYLISLPIETEMMRILIRVVLAESISGWIPFMVDPIIYVKMLVLGITTYSVVALLELKKIKNVPMSEALKNVE